MNSLLRGPFDVIGRALGQWWFDAQTPIDWGPALATVNESYADSRKPLPEATGSERPKCKLCGDPNFSLEGEICIACRILLPTRPSP